MPPFSVNVHRFDPYKPFKFRVRMDGRYVAGVSRISGLKRTTEVVTHREGGDVSQSRRMPGRTTYEPITFERGVTHDTAFEDWANLEWRFGAGLGAESDLDDYRKDLIIEIYNEAGQVAIAYRVYRAWVSEFVPVVGFEANQPGVATERIVIQHEGFERDRDVTEPDEGGSGG